ncbi:class I SAM-dependent methyltransferase [Streptomyces californicus]|uniref:class I SAM-dependent methyltransferase n=1 Tax=Streptomyces californicus TaxID=67351 RepID=UPI0037D1FF76
MTRVTTTDLWHHYGRTRAERDHAVPDSFRWAWSQQDGPGSEVLGDLTGKTLADLGAGTARHAAYLAVHHAPGRIDAVDASPAQYDMATALYADLAPRLRLVHADVVAHLRVNPGAYDVLYSHFGAVDFTDPREVIPAAACGLRPGGRLVFSTLAHYLSGKPAQPDVTAAEVEAKTPEGESATMYRWVLQEHVWAKLLEQAGFTGIHAAELPAGDGPRSAVTLLVRAELTAS